MSRPQLPLPPLPPPQLPMIPEGLVGIERFRWIYRVLPTEPLELLGGTGFLAIGLWFLWPHNDFPTNGVLFAIYGSHAIWWGWAFTGLGIYKLWVIGWRPYTRHRLTTCLLNLIAIWQMFLAYVAIQPRHVAVVVTLLGMLHQFWIVRRNRGAWRRQR